jgi:S-adenosylmethionine:tRNA ribosyltransferase-isomerase
LKTSLFDFQLPDNLIATRPAEPRDSARLLVVEERLRHKQVSDLPVFLQPGDVMVLNDTKVIPARLWGKRGEAKIEILLHKNLGGGQWKCFAKPAKKLKTDDLVS